MFPPDPASGVVPIVRLKIPAGVPSIIVPEIEMGPAALIIIFPPSPVLVVPLLIWAPSAKFNDPVVMAM
jgi:hypothetical protein